LTSAGRTSGTARRSLAARAGHLLFGLCQRGGERPPELVQHVLVLHLPRLDLVQFVLEVAVNFRSMTFGKLSTSRSVTIFPIVVA